MEQLKLFLFVVSLLSDLLLLLWFHLLTFRLQRHLEVVWANLTPDPGPRPPPLRWSKAHEDWMGHAAKVDDTDTPSHQQQASGTYLSVLAGRAFGLRQRVEDFV